MTKKILFPKLALLAIFTFSSCSEENDYLPTVSSESVGEVLCGNEAIVQEAIMFVSSLDDGTTRSGSAYSVNSIQKMNLETAGDTRVDDSLAVPDFYSVGLKDEMGTVILAEKGNTIKPLAYFQGENDLDINEVLEDTTSTLSFIVKVLVEQNLDMEESNVVSDTRAVTNTIVERLEPKCKVYWHQHAPFNKYCFTDKGAQAVAGCVAIAGAQALTVLQPREPLISSWDAVIAEYYYYFSNTEVTKEVARLIAEIGAKIHTNYGETSSGAQKSDLIKHFKDKYGVVDYDCERAIDVLKTEHGVIIIGGYATKTTKKKFFKKTTTYSNGHAFIADGYVKYGDEGKKNDDPYYLHINYGWGNNSYNGYILSANKNYTEDAGKKYIYKITYATLTYPSEKNW